MENPYFLALFFFLIAIFYSSVGFGGGSSYLAILTMAGLDLYLLRSTALVCSIIVVSSSTYIFYQEGYLNIKRSLPLILAGIPMAIIGSYIPLKSPYIFNILGFSLLLASVLLWFKRSRHISEHRLADRKAPIASIIGGAIGFLSGMIGISGGILLSPVLNFLNWNRAKRIAAIASLFILINSVAQLLNQWIQHPLEIDLSWAWPLLLAVLLGGQIGSRLAVVKFNNLTIQRTTAILIFIVGIKILNDYLFHFDNFFK